MDDNNVNQNNNATRRPNMRPLQPVGANYAPNTRSETRYADEPQDMPPVYDKPQKNTALVGVICGILGLIIGGAGIFGLMYLMPEPKTDCVERTCPKCPASISHDLTTSFLTLESSNQNIIYSPLSIRYGLSLLNAGAAGTTKTQIENVLGDSELPKYENVSDVLSLANAVFVRDAYADKVLPEYLETVQNDYRSELIYDGFADSTNMDNWVSQKTFGLINQIGIQPEPDTNMVLANTLAIQMAWQNSFDSDDTNGKTFYKQDDEEVEATTMTQLTHAEGIKYYTDDDVTLLSMPLEETDTGVGLDFVAVMPEGDLSDYVDELDISSIETFISEATPASVPEDGVKIYVPKFKFDYELDFKTDLQNLGIAQAFEDDADFSAMASEPLKVSAAVHKANIDFSEDGIKAAAVTAFAMAENAAAEGDQDIPQPIVIDIDHPFLFLIRDRASGAVWFIGTVYEPNLWADDSAEYYR